MSKFIGCIGDLRKVIMSMKPYAHHLMSLKECQWKGLYEILFKMFSVHLILEHLVSLLPLIEHINHISTSLVIDKLYGGLSENNIQVHISNVDSMGHHLVHQQHFIRGICVLIEKRAKANFDIQTSI